MDKAEEREEHQQFIDPWTRGLPHPSTFSGGDLYLTILTASLGGKAVHGANLAPTCEVLGKGIGAGGLANGYGKIIWDTTEYDEVIEPLGNDISDKFYSHHAYRGSITTSGSVLAYESGLWEPSNRRRAKSASLLAAAMHAHGLSREDAVKIVGTITSDVIDEEAINSAIIPASHLKREMASVSKANHRVFSKGTLQCGITWDDTRISFPHSSGTVAFDWGRVTALARYIAEANIQNCESFRDISRGSGIPYYIVRNAWAYVTPTDYLFTTEAFSNVPRVHLQDFGIPSLKDAFIGHEQDIMVAIHRTLKQNTSIGGSDALVAYQRIYKRAKERTLNRKGKSVVGYTGAQEFPMIGSSTDPEEVAISQELAVAVSMLMTRAIAYRCQHNSEIRDLIRKYERYEENNKSLARMSLVDEISTLMFAKTTWIMTQAMIGDWIEENVTTNQVERDNAAIASTMILNSKKQALVGYPTHLGVDIMFSPSVLEKLRGSTEEYLRVVKDIDFDVRFTQDSLVEYNVRKSTKALEQLKVNGVKLLETLRDTTSKKYKEWYDEARDSQVENFHLGATKYLFAHYALEHLELGSCLNKAGGYIEGTLPRQSYVYQCVCALADDFDVDPPKLSRLVYADALSIAKEIEIDEELPFSTIAGVVYATSLLDDVVGQLMVDKVYTLQREEFDTLRQTFCTEQSPTYDTAMMDEAEGEAFIAQMMADMDKQNRAVTRSLYEDCLNTYPSLALAEKYAIVNGYANFKEAFEDLQEDVMFTDNSVYVAKARGNIASKPQESPTNSKKRGYSSII